MSFRTWMYVFAIIGLTLAGSGQAQETRQPTQPQASEQEEPAKSLPIPLIVEIVEDDAAAVSRQRSETEARQREIDDLAAQQGMNAATQAMNEATQRMASDSREMTIATWVGIFLLFITLLLTLMANIAAVRAVKVTETTGMTQMRAWLSFTDWRLEGLGVDGAVERFQIVLQWRNTGSTPAINVNAVTGFKGETPLNKHGGVVDIEDGDRSIVGPGLPFVTSLLISPEDLFATNEKPAIIQCFLRYDTVFEPLHGRDTVATFKVRYIGRASLLEVKRGEINARNFAFQPIGSDSDRMT